MASEITVEVTGDDPVENLQAVLGNLGIDEGGLERLAVTMEFEQGPARAGEDDLEGPDRPGPPDIPGEAAETGEQVRPGTNQHIALTALAAYLECHDADTATRDDVANLPENPLSVQQTGNAMSLLHNGKGLLAADKRDREDGGGYVNAYRLTDAGRHELERIGYYSSGTE